MKALNEAIDGAGRFDEFLDKLTREDRTAQLSPAPGVRLGDARQPDENRAEHRARLKRERREAKKVRV